jgi:hypothetical protein
LQLLGVANGLGPAFRRVGVAFLRLDDGELVVAIDEDVVGHVAARPSTGPLQPAERDCLAADPAGLDDAPAGGAEGGVDELGAGFGFVHGGPARRDRKS